MGDHSGIQRIETHSEDETEALAASLAREIRGANGGGPGTVVGLTGDLGAGKSVFVRACAAALGVDERMPSPSYTIVEEYSADGIPVLHIDLYRIDDEDEFAMIGVEERFASSISFIEWIDRAPGVAATADIRVTISIVPEDPTRRTIEIERRNESTTRA